MTPEVDVAIVGAGVAGLAAAAELRRAGAAVVVLEAASRVGGRAWTAHPRALGGVAFDHGAFWFHDAGRNPLVQLADPRELIDAAGLGVSRTFIGSHPASEHELRGYEVAEHALYDVAADMLADPVADASLADAIDRIRDLPWAATVETWEGPVIAAADARALSLRDWHDNALSGRNLIAPHGMGDFVLRHLAPRAGPVSLDTHVSAIDWDGARIRVTTSRGTVSAGACIVTVSTGVLAADHIVFRPALPATTREAIAALPMGLLMKVAVRASGADRLGLADHTSLGRQVARGEPMMTLKMWPFGQDHVLGYIGGEVAWRLAAEGEAACEAFLRAELRGMLGGDADRALAAGAVVTRWDVDPFALGAYAYAHPGHAAARAALAVPLADGALRFAGEATRTDGLAGTVGGAFLDGQMAAQNILRDSARRFPKRPASV